ncbi:hypothetical protein A2U01_0076353, partial [Trifolium medium]|nr:hypothetical protein [Trifolium medium]
DREVDQAPWAYGRSVEAL